MNSKATLLKLIKDITIPVIVFVLIGSLIMIEQIGFHAEPNTVDSCLIDEDSWHNVRNINAGTIASNAPKCLIIFDDKDDDSISLKNNIKYVLNSINVSAETKVIHEKNEDDTIKYEQLPEEPININLYDDVIFCISDLFNTGIDVSELSAWISNGGNCMFAMRVDPSENFQTWSGLLGIVADEVPEVITADSLRFKTDIMIGVEGREFSDDVINSPALDITLDKDCIVHISTCGEEETPLLWEKDVEQGKIIVSNTDLFESKSDRGLFVSAYCKFYPVFAYPVINAAVYCIDDCPAPTPAGYDENVLSQYGYTVTDYISNIWMPAIQKIAEEYGVRYSTFVVQSYEDDVNGPFDNRDNIKSAKYYASLILNMGGEIGIHGYNHQPLVLEGFQYDKENEGYMEWPSLKKIFESIDSVINYTESLADDLYVQAYIAPSNVISDEALHGLQNKFEDLRVYAGVYVGTPDQMVQEFEVLDNGIVYCPRLTADMQMEDSEWWVQINELNYHYVESNFIHPDDILDEERNDGGDFNQMLSNYKEMIEWNQRYGLKTATISECGAAVQKFCNINYTQELEDNTLKIDVSGRIDKVYLMLRLNAKKPIKIRGGAYKKISDGVYILEIKSDKVEIKLVDQE